MRFGLITALLATAAVVFLAVGPVVHESGSSCRGGSGQPSICTAGESTHGLGPLPILAVPLAGGLMVATGAALRPRRIGGVLLVLGVAVLWTIALVSIASIGLLLLPAAVTALLTARRLLPSPTTQAGSGCRSR